MSFRFEDERPKYQNTTSVNCVYAMLHRAAARDCRFNKSHRTRSLMNRQRPNTEFKSHRVKSEVEK